MVPSGFVCFAVATYIPGLPSQGQGRTVRQQRTAAHWVASPADDHAYLGKDPGGVATVAADGRARGSFSQTITLIALLSPGEQYGLKPRLLPVLVTPGW